eukprot:m.221610 g.221610  ORF g.221610 m.221610 type:complete len:371 (-) comp15928_c0_seq23:1735-2847(-)
MADLDRLRVSVIMPVFNCEQYLPDALSSIISQQLDRHGIRLELSVYDDGSSDKSHVVVESWRERLQQAGIDLLLEKRDEKEQKHVNGPGQARNRAVSQSTGGWLCFLDADDYMLPDRIRLQWLKAQEHPRAIIGCRFRRDPVNSTDRYTRWCNSLSQTQLTTQRFRDCTIIQPTWFMSRDVFNRVGGYRPDLAEDLLFFYDHFAKFDQKDEVQPEVASNAQLFPFAMVDEELLVYRYRGSESLTPRVSKKLLLSIRVRALESQVLETEPWCSGFYIWGAGKDGRAFYQQLQEKYKVKVKAFFDVDEAKLGWYNDHGPERKKLMRRVPVKHIREVCGPIIMCVALDRTNGEFEGNVKKAGLKEGEDFYYFC